MSLSGTTSTAEDSSEPTPTTINKEVAPSDLHGSEFDAEFPLDHPKNPIIAVMTPHIPLPTDTAVYGEVQEGM